MFPSSRVRYSLAAAALALSGAARADIIISEVHPTGSAAAGYNADFFELTNTGASVVDISGWKMDDNSNLFANSVALRGVTSIAAGSSVIFIEGTANGSTDATIIANFETAWFGGSVPAWFTIGTYGGTSVGLSAAADAVNIFTGGGTLVTRVGFGASTVGVTFDNAAGLSGNVTLTQLSVVGVNGAFLSANGEVGSPGVVPTPGSLALLSLSGLGFLRRSRKS